MPEEYVDMIKPYLGHMINDHKTENSVNNANQFCFSKDSEEIRTMQTKSRNIEIMMSNERVEIIDKLSESLLQNYHKDLEESIRESEFVPDSINLLYYHLQKIGWKRGVSYIDSPEWLKNKKSNNKLKK